MGSGGRLPGDAAVSLTHTILTYQSCSVDHFVQQSLFQIEQETI